MTFYIFHNQPRPQFEPFCFFESIFTSEECDRIVALGESLSIQRSLTGDGADTLDEVRKSRNSWIDFTPESQWVFDKLANIVLGVNEARYKFQLTGFMEHLQFTLYDEHGSHYKMHTDFGKGPTAQRKLSCVLMLSHPEEYEGGELVFYEAGEHKYPRGTLVVFPSFQVHGVKPVTSGLRKSLVAWVSGEPYR